MRDLNLLWIGVLGAPLFVLAMFRAVWFLAGAEWNDPALAAFLSTMLGSLIGLWLVISILDGAKVTLKDLEEWK